MKVIAFDFDGTLVNNWLLTVDSAQAAAETSHVNLTATDIKILRQKGWVKFLRQTRWPFLKATLFLGLFARKVLKQESNLLQMPPALVQLILELFAGGNIICVVSSSRTNTIKSVLKRHNLLHAIREVHGNQLMWSKHNKLIELKRNTITPRSTITLATKLGMQLLRKTQVTFQSPQLGDIKMNHF